MWYGTQILWNGRQIKIIIRKANVMKFYIRIAFNAALFLSVSMLKAQTLKPSVIATSGGYSSNTTVSLSWTMGETFTQTLQSGSTVLTQGFQQPNVVLFYDITASAGANGSVSPNGVTPVAAGGTQTYTITPATCYSIEDVVVNGVSVGAVSTYTFINVTANQTISATFILNAPIQTPVVTGIKNVCPFEGNGTQLSYTVSNTSPGTTSYAWIVPPTVTIVSGQGTETLIVSINTGFAANANKQIRVTALSICGNSPQAVFYLVAQLPVTPSAITGNSNVCPILGTTDSYTYTIPSVLAASGYIWSATDPNVTITSVNGAGPNDTMVTVRFASGFQTSAITVHAANGCGTSGARSITIVRASASTPGPVSGPTNACPHMAPGGTPAIYSIAPVANATSYSWMVPAGTIMSAGPNDYTINVTYPANFVSGTITVTAMNGCGLSLPRTLSISKLNPATPGVIDVIQAGFCGDAGGRSYTYTLASLPANATSVLWTVPTSGGAVLVSGQGTNSITVSYPNTAVAGFITAQSVSNCGVSLTRSLPVKLPACPPPAFTRTLPNTGAEPKGSVITALIQSMDVKIFPNPTVADFKMQVITFSKEQINVRILDAQGRAFKIFTVAAYQTTPIGADLKAGAYLLEVRQGVKVKTMKMIKF